MELQLLGLYVFMRSACLTDFFLRRLRPLNLSRRIRDRGSRGPPFRPISEVRRPKTEERIPDQTHCGGKSAMPSEQGTVYYWVGSGLVGLVWVRPDKHPTRTTHVPDTDRAIVCLLKLLRWLGARVSLFSEHLPLFFPSPFSIFLS